MKGFSLWRSVTEGYRLCLVYNLMLAGKKSTLPNVQPPDYRDAASKAARVLSQWKSHQDQPMKAAWLLDHAYSSAALSFEGLKHADAARAEVLRSAAAKAGCVLYLAIVHIEEYGPAEIEYGYSRYGWDDSDAEDYSIVEVSDGEYKVSDWVSPVPDEEPGFGDLPLVDGELLPAGALEDEPPDEDRLTEATGNEGASFERIYHRATLVLWDADRTLWANVAATLLQRSEVPPEEPSHWKLPTRKGCTCQDCVALMKFARDPDEKSARFPLNKARRMHLHQRIDKDDLDMTHETERKGSPYTLVCTKTRRTHERRLRQYAKDVEDMAWLARHPPQGEDELVRRVTLFKAEGG